jgi:hypothetical protein
VFEELFKPLGAHRRFEILQAFVGEVAAKLVEAAFVAAVAAVGQPLAFGAQVDGGVLPERRELIALIAHGIAIEPRDLADS